MAEAPLELYFGRFPHLFPPKPATLTIGHEIGRGGNGTVYEGEYEGRAVAVKKLHGILLQAAKNTGAQKLLDDFVKECSLLKNAKHQRIVEFYGAFYDEETKEPLLVMEKMTEDLSVFLEKRRGQLSLEEALRICLAVVEGLHYLHTEAKMSHRDLNDKNVMFTAEGEVKIGDLGQARLKTKEYYMTTRQPGALTYMAPECLQEKPKYNEMVDVFSAGVLMLEICTQERPKVQPIGICTIEEVKRRKADLDKLECNHVLKSIILRCLRDKPEDRPSIEELYETLTVANSKKVSPLPVVSLIQREVVVFGEAGCGKSTLANRILGVPDSAGFKTGYSVKSLTKEIALRIAVHGNYQILMFDTPGFSGSTDNNKKQMKIINSHFRNRCPNRINCILFVRAIGSFTKSEKSMFEVIKKELHPRARSISALVITKCEDLNEDERRKYKTDFMSDKDTIEMAQFMDRGIHLVGFPNRKNIQELLKEQIEMDEKTVRKLILEFADEYSGGDIFR